MNARTALTLIAAAATATGSFAQGPTLPPGLAPPSPPSATQQGNSATAAPKDACSNCATITTIQMTTERQDWTPLGTVAPGSVGIAGAGVSEGRTAYVIGSDLSNSDAATNISSAQFIKATVPARPRVLMGQFYYKF